MSRIGNAQKLPEAPTLPPRQNVSGGGLPAYVVVKLLILLGAVATAVFVVAVAVQLSWQRDVMPSVYGVIITSLLVACGAGFAVIRLNACRTRKTTVKRRQSTQQFMRYQVGLGFALLLVGVFTAIVSAGVSANILGASTARPNLSDDLNLCGLRLLLAINMAILGALFFVANSLRKRRICEEAFDEERFWGGLWYRMGEAVLFTLVGFLVLRSFKLPTPSSTYIKEYDLLMPIVGLSIGMFIRTGERLVFGFAERIFDAASSLLPLAQDEFKRKSETKPQLSADAPSPRRAKRRAKAKSRPQVALRREDRFSGDLAA